MTPNIQIIGFSALAFVGLASAPLGQVPTLSEDSAALQQWTLNIEHYLVIREQAARAAPPPRFPMSAVELLRAEAAFAAEIRARRSGAHVGDMFTSDVQRTFRKVIARTLTDHQIAAGDLAATLLADVLPGSASPAVNQRFPWQLGSAMPACLLTALPELPKGIEYRLVGRDLILLDLDANLVIDILREALPRTTGAESAGDPHRE